MSESQLEAVMELAALPELSGLHPDDLASLARCVAWPHGDEVPPEPQADAGAVHFLLAGSAALEGHGPRFEAPALIGALEAVAGVATPGAVRGEGARIATLERAAFCSLLDDVFELWLAMLRHGMARLLAAGCEPGGPPGPDRAQAREGEAELVRRIRLLAGCELLGDLRVHTLGRLARGMEERRLHAGVPLWEEGAAASRCFLVLEGSFAQGAGRWSERPLVAPAGAMLGLRDALADARHASRLVTTDAGRVLCLPREHLIDELEDDPEAAEALLAAVARRALRAEAGAR